MVEEGHLYILFASPMWSLIKRDLGEFVTTLKDDVAIVSSAISRGGDVGEDDYEVRVPRSFRAV